jgi:signal peptidase I
MSNENIKVKNSVENIDEENLVEKKNPIRDLVEIIIFAVVLALFIRTYVIQAFKIPTGSMESTLMIGDHILVNKFIYSPVPKFLRFLFPVKEPERGEIIVFKYPLDMTRDFVKRLIGLENETIKVEDKKVFINGQRIEFKGKEQYVVPFTIPDLDFYGPTTIPKGNFFMMGDNRDRSSDSRKWGFLDRNLIKGRVIFVYFSLKNDWKDVTYEGEKTFFKSLINWVRWERFFRIIK